MPEEGIKQVSLSEDVWERLKIASAERRLSMREIAERAILKELDGKAKN